MTAGSGKSALVLVADGSEEIEAVTVVDILRRAHVKVTVAAVGPSAEITCSRGVRLVADCRLPEVERPGEAFEAICLPGGLRAAETFRQAEAVQQVLQAGEAGGKAVLAAMCASTTALRAAEVGRGRRVTSYPAVCDQLQDFYCYQEDPVVTDGKLVTSRGPGTAMAWALAIVRALVGESAMQQVADGLILMFPPPQQ